MLLPRRWRLQNDYFAYITIYNALIDLPEGYNPADANTYGVEEIVKFIYDDRPLAQWDDFVDTLLTTYDYQQMVDASKAVDISG